LIENFIAEYDGKSVWDNPRADYYLEVLIHIRR